MKVNRTLNSKEVVEEVNYELVDILRSQTEHLWADYWSAFGSNLSLSTIDRKHELAPRADSPQKAILIGETILNIILASLIVVAARRKFTPKKPTGT